MGTLYRRPGSKQWMMGVVVAGRQHCKSAHTSNKRLAKKMLSRWETEVFEGRFQLPKSNPPRFESWADDFLKTVAHPNTRRRYTSSVGKLKSQFKGLRLADISLDRIEDYKDARLASGIGPATVNRDLAVLRRMLRLAERKRFIARSPFVEVELLEERKLRRKPHIVTFEEEERFLMTAEPHIRVLAALLLETGLRPNREALPLKWDDVDLINDFISIRESKTQAGIRLVPLSVRCKAELQNWRRLVGPDFSCYVFPNTRDRTKPLKDIRRSWAKALKNANLPYFWIYNLRHTFASRLSAAGVSDLFVAQMIGHSSPTILQTYAKAIDQYRRDAIHKLEHLRTSYKSEQAIIRLN